MITRIKRYLREQWTSALPSTSIARSWSSKSALAAAQDALGQAVIHLGYLGYTVSDGPGEWKYADHPRHDLFLRASFVGIRLSASVRIGASIANTRASWMEFLNELNGRSYVTCFSMYEDEIGAHRIKMRAVFSGEYSRWVFAILMDMWQLDVDRVYDKLASMPASDAAQADAADTEAAAVTVH